jgi:hypothetical protein
MTTRKYHFAHALIINREACETIGVWCLVLTFLYPGVITTLLRHQGPKAAMACPSATLFRNYFWEGRGQAGGSEQQLDTTRDIAVPPLLLTHWVLVAS